ncbi:MAG: CDP-alcohol phosphatidyltransferase family protein [Candidatus Comchoanobacterales bacterium]
MIRKFLSLADYVSLARLFLIYPLLVSITQKTHLITFILIFIILVSDFLDGFLAKSMGFRSKWGSIIDACSDGIIVFATLFTLAWLGNISWLFFAMFCARQLTLILLFNQMRKARILLQAQSIMSGKICHVSLLLLTLYSILKPLDPILEVLMSLLVLVSTYDYIMTYRQAENTK